MVLFQSASPSKVVQCLAIFDERMLLTALFNHQLPLVLGLSPKLFQNQFCSLGSNKITVHPVQHLLTLCAFLAPGGMPKFLISPNPCSDLLVW